MYKAFWCFFDWLKMSIKTGCIEVSGVISKGFPKVTTLVLQGLQAIFLETKNKFEPGKRI